MISLSDKFIRDPPKNTISSLIFSKKDNILISTSWDCSLYIYKEKDGMNSWSLLWKQIFSDPQSDCCYEGMSSNNMYSVGLDGDLNRLDIEMLSTNLISNLSKPLNKVNYDEERKIVFLCGWDNYLVCFDGRTNNLMSNKKKPFLIDTELQLSNFLISGEKIIVTGVDKSNNSMISIFDIRNTSKSLITYESPLKFPTSAMCNTNKHDGFIIGSIEGKIAVEYFDQIKNIETNERNKLKSNYAFKCHREESDAKSTIFPVNCISFHPELNTYFSGGSDGFLYGWDNEKRKKIYKSPHFNLPILASSFNYDGSKIAIAISENYEKLCFPEICEQEKHKIMIIETNLFFN